MAESLLDRILPNMSYLNIKKIFHISHPSGLEQVTKCLVQFSEIMCSFTHWKNLISPLFFKSVSLPAKLLRNISRILILKNTSLEWGKWTWNFLTLNQINIQQDKMCISVQMRAIIYYIPENKHLRAFAGYYAYKQVTSWPFI